MANGDRSLRAMVTYWLVPDPAGPVRVTRFKNQPAKRECYVCVEAFCGGKQATMFFFRHPDRIWRIFPPERSRPALRVLDVSSPDQSVD